MKTDFEKYVEDCMSVIKTYTDSLDERTLSQVCWIWKDLVGGCSR